MRNQIVKHRIETTRRFSSYTSNGLMATKHMVKLEGETIWRRVYERWDHDLPSGSNLYDGQPVPIINILGVRHDLSQEERELIGWRGATRFHEESAR